MSDTKLPKLKTVKGPLGSFPVDITVTHLNGNQASITFDCIARAQTEWSKLRDATHAGIMLKIKAEKARQKAAAKEALAAREQDPAKEDDAAEAIEFEKVFTERIKNDTDLALVVAQGWDLDDSFAPATISDMEDRFPGAINSLVSKYSEMIYGARKGNS